MELAVWPRDAAEVIALLPDKFEVLIFYSSAGGSCQVIKKELRKEVVFAGELFYEEFQQLCGSNLNTKPSHNAKDVRGHPTRHIQVTLWGAWRAFAKETFYLFQPEGVQVAVFQDNTGSGHSSRVCENGVARWYFQYKGHLPID